jgi:hypothetical protein
VTGFHQKYQTSNPIFTAPSGHPLAFLLPLKTNRYRWGKSGEKKDRGFYRKCEYLRIFIRFFLLMAASASGGRGPSARGAYMLRKSFVLVFIRFRVKARQHDQGFKAGIANTRSDQLTHRSTDPLIKSPRKNF